MSVGLVVMKIAVLLALLSAVSERSSSSSSSSSSVHGDVGQNVTLSCKYDATAGQMYACWGRGAIPSSGCNQLLISSDGLAVKEGTRASSRYQLLGRLDEGDVSLTILNITEADAGEYGCRVEISGWFNDQKHHIHLVVMEAAQSTTSASTATAETGTEGVRVSPTAVQLTSTDTLVTSSLGPLQAEKHGALTVVLVFVAFGFIVLVTVVGLLVITRKWGQLSKNCPSQQINTLFQLSSVSSSLSLRRNTATVENIYQIDVGEDGGVYEDLP